MLVLVHVHVHWMCTACVLHVHCVCAACVLHVRCVCTARALHVRCMCAACALRVRCMCAACALQVMMGFQSNILDTVEVMEQVSALLQGHSSLLRQFNEYLSMVENVVLVAAEPAEPAASGRLRPPGAHLLTQGCPLGPRGEGSPLVCRSEAAVALWSLPIAADFAASFDHSASCPTAIGSSSSRRT